MLGMSLLLTYGLNNVVTLWLDAWARARVVVVSLLFSACMTLNMSLKRTVPQFPHCKVGLKVVFNS